MEFTVSKADLVRELNLSQGVVEKKTTIPILSNVLVETMDGRIQLTSTDLELGVRVSCPARVKKQGAGTIPAKKLLDYVRLLPEADIDIKIQENHWASLTCGRSRTRIAGMSRESFPELPVMPEAIADLPAKTLATMINRTIFAISMEESRFTLNGALLLLRPHGIVMVATDGHRLSMVETALELPSITGQHRALMPRKAMAEVLKLSAEAGADATIEFAGDDNHLFFRLGERLLLSRKLTGNFPDYERVLPKEHPHALQLNRDEFRGAVERVSQFSDERSKAIRVKFAPGELSLHSSLSDTGESEETVAAEYSGEPMEIGFNATYMLEFLRVVSDEQVTLLVRDPNSAGELRPATSAEGSSYRYVVMPMRI